MFFVKSVVGTVYTLAMIILFSVYAFSLFTAGHAFSEGAPDFSCKDPSAFHTRKINDTHEGIIMPQAMSTSPYMIDVSAQTFRPGDRVTGGRLKVSVWITYINRILLRFLGMAYVLVTHTSCSFVPASVSRRMQKNRFMLGLLKITGDN